MRLHLYIAASLLIATAVIAQDTDNPTAREWTSISGQKIQATYMKKVNSQVYLKTDDGKTIRIEISRLSKEDRKHLNDIATADKLAKKRALGTFSDEQIAEFKKTWTDESGQKYEFKGTFSAQKLETKDKDKYTKSGTIPIRITTGLYEVKEAGRKKQYKRLNGECEFYLINEETGKLILKEKGSLAKMCPS